MGGVSFYKTAEDGYLARTKGGVDAERIKNSPEFERTRENGAEFGRAGVAAKLLRAAFRALILNASDGRMASRLTGEMMKVLKADTTSLRGQRNVIDGEAELLQGFEFNINSSLESCLLVPYTINIDRPSGVVTVQVSGFDPRVSIVAPQGATHARIVVASALVDFQAETHVSDVNGGQDMPITGGIVQPLGMNLSFTQNSAAPVFVALGIQFSQQVNNNLYSLKNGAYNALQVVAVNGI